MPTDVDPFFSFSHLPGHLREVAKPVCVLFEQMSDALPDGTEKEAGMRKLLEAKDCFVRAKLQEKS